MAPSATRRSLLVLIKAFVSFRVLLALTTSASVTAMVAGPMAYQAAKARDEVLVVAPPETTTTTTTEVPEVVVTTAPTTSTTTTSTTTTTTVDAPAEQPTTTDPTLITVPAVTPTGLLVSSWADHADPILLEEARVSGEVWMFFDGSGVTDVSYWVDDPTGSGTPDRMAEQPFDLDADGVDARRLGIGRHTLLAEVTTIDGTYRRLATFEVVG